LWARPDDDRGAADCDDGDVVGLDILRIMRATQLPGWAPTVRLRDGLAATIDFERRCTPQ
jgi:nucleoside-diphosphate-sugar epimerase